jgi:hypothetical protein
MCTSVPCIALQERTEQMMRELTGKVINLLDDPSLEAVKVRTVATYSLCMRCVRAVCNVLLSWAYFAVPWML